MSIMLVFIVMTKIPKSMVVPSSSAATLVPVLMSVLPCPKCQALRNDECAIPYFSLFCAMFSCFTYLLFVSSPYIVTFSLPAFVLIVGSTCKLPMILYVFNVFRCLTEF